MGTSETVGRFNLLFTPIHTTDDRWFSVRIIPYRRLDNVVDGVVLTLVDLSASKALESSLRADARA